MSHDRLIFNMGISIPGKDGVYIETGPCTRSGMAHIPGTRWYTDGESKRVDFGKYCTRSYPSCFCQQVITIHFIDHVRILPEMNAN